MNKIRIAVVGGGSRGISVTKNAIQQMEQYELVGYCERHPIRLQEVKRETGLPDEKLYADFDQMLQNCDFEVLYVVTEPLTQTALCRQAMEAGKDVLCDVPVSYSLSDCWELVLTAERTGRVFKMVEQLRHSAFIERARAMNENGEFGKIVYAEGQYIHNVAYNRAYWDSEKGIYVNHETAAGNPNCVRADRIPVHPIAYNPHEMSPLLKVLQDRVKVVSCMSTRMGSYSYPADDIIDVEAAIMRTEKDTLLRIVNSFSTAQPAAPAHWYQIIGTNASFETQRADWDFVKVWKKPADYESFEHRQDYEKIEQDLWAPSEITELSKHSSHFGLDYLPFENYANHRLHGEKLELDVYASVEASAPGIVASISAEYNGMPFCVPDFRPNETRKAGQEPATRKAHSLYGDILREATYRTTDWGKNVGSI